MTEIIDTNVILRFLVGDNKSQQKKAKVWFEEAEKGKRKLLIKPLIIAEACFVLESFYKRNRKEIADSFEVFLSQKWFSIDERRSLRSLWPWYRKNFHFVDSFLLACARNSKSKILSFDKKLLKNL